MLRILTERDGKPLILLGLDWENVRRLTEDDQPILINLRHLNPENETLVTNLPDVDISIFLMNAKNLGLLRERFGI